MTTFYKRLVYVFESEGFKNINDFALNGLKYASSSKLARLKDETKKPSVDILEDISNMFENVNLHWLITGKGKKFIDTHENYIHDSEFAASQEANISYDKELIVTQRELLKMKDQRISELESKLAKPGKDKPDRNFMVGIQK